MSKPVNPASLARAGSEHSHQVAIFAWAALNFSKYPELRLMFAIPNGGLRNPITAANLKAEGVRAGVPDIFLPVIRGPYHGLFIELKKEGGRPSLEQKAFIDALQRQGYGACVCIGWQETTEVIEKYLNFSS